jgi:hypothetical protein
MSFPISQLYPLLLVLWVLMFWCRSRVLRTAMFISLGLHAIFLVRINNWGINETNPERIISFTFVQGGDEREQAEGKKIGLSTNVSPIAQSSPWDHSIKGPIANDQNPSTAREKSPLPEPLRVEKELPKIEDKSLIDFSADPLAESYRRELQKLIARHQKIPAEVLAGGMEARVKVWFNLSRDGKLNPPVFVDPKIRSSRDFINKAGEESVLSAAQHFPPFPEHIHRAEIWFFVYLDYSNVRFRED